MKINVGRGVRGNVSSLPPSNKGMHKIAQDRIDSEISRANRRHKEALDTDGTPVYIFTRSTAGYPCTCTKVKNITLEPDIESEIQEQEDIVGDVEFDTPGSKAFRVRGLEDLVNNRANTFKERTNNSPKSLLKQAHQANIEENYAHDRESERLANDQDMAASSLMQEIDEEFQDPDDQALLPQKSGPSLFGGVGTACPICFGSGFVDGYKLFGGQRIILDASGTFPYTLYDSEINDSETPFKFILDRSESLTDDNGHKGPSVVWTVHVPTYFKSVIAIFVRNGLESAKGYRIQARAVGSATWTDFNVSYLTSRKGSNNKFEIRVLPIVSQNPGNSYLEFTHVEIYLMMVDRLKANMPDFSKSVDLNEFEVLQTTTFEMSSAVPNLDRESVIVETKHNQAWSVTEIEQKKTQAHQLWNMNVTARIIQRDEPRYLLNLVKGKIINLGFGQQEQVQGNTHFSGFKFIPVYAGEAYDHIGTFPNNFQLNVLSGNIVLNDSSADAFKAMVMKPSFDFSPSMSTIADVDKTTNEIVAAGYTTYGPSLSGITLNTIEQDTFVWSANDLTIQPDVGESVDVGGILLYYNKNAVSDNQKELILYIKFDDPINVTNELPLVMDWSDNGIIRFVYNNLIA